MTYKNNLNRNTSTMSKQNETPIGGRFELCKLIYEVRAATSCEGCACYIESENECTDGHGDNFEPCSNIDRDDRKSVIFVQVGEAKE